jgi:glycyl-tRNA synthetase beta chain
MSDFLFEAGLEEIPARMIAPAQAELGLRVFDLLKRSRLLGSNATMHNYSTPRRLAVLVKDVKNAQTAIQEHLMGPSWSIAFKDGEATPAGHAFAKKAGVEVNALTKITTGKGEYVLAPREAGEICASCEVAAGSARS